MPAQPYHRPMEFGVLGPLRVRGAHGVVDVVGGKERLLLAHLVQEQIVDAAGDLVTNGVLHGGLLKTIPPCMHRAG